MGASEYLFIAVFFSIPALIGALLARSRGKNVLLWGFLSAFFPFFAFILWFNKPEHEIPGHFRKCSSCNQTYPWKLPVCKYCGTPHDPGMDR